MKKIVVIEDAQDVRTSLRDLLENAGYQVFLAEDGKLGYDLICGVKPDIVLCDIMMPKMSGYELLDKLKQGGIYSFPFVFLTARTEISDLRTGMNLGADDYLFKPYRAAELLKVLETRLAKFDKMNHERKEQQDGPETGLEKSEFILVSKKKDSRLVRIADIEYIQARSEYTQITLSTGEHVMLRKLMHEWEKILPEKYFLRIHRSTIINLAHVEKIEKWFNRSNKVWMKNTGQTFFISQRYSARLKDKIPVLK